MKLIGIDARLYFETGVGVYLRNFLHYLQQYAPSEYRFNVYVLQKNSSQIHFDNPYFIKREVSSRWHSLSEQMVFHRVLMNDHLDLMHFTYFSYPILYSRPFIATIHDLTPLLFKTGKASTLPSYIYDLKHAVFSYVLSQQVKKSKAIITPTESVKKQIIDIYGNKYDKKISVLYEGVNYEFFKAQPNKKLKDYFVKPYLLYVGNFYPHKNVDTLIDAFTKLDNQQIDLVLAGPNNYFSGKIEKYVQEHTLSNIRLYHPTASEDLLYLYQNAIALINPSLSEGFGLPIVEAAYCKTPIIASNIDVFKELLGDSYIAFNPTDTQALTKILQNTLESHERQIPVLNAQYSFESMVKRYVSLLNNLL